MTLNNVLKFQDLMLKAGSKSTAVGGYQFLQRTLKATISQMGLSGNEVWTPSLQDSMAIHLMKGRKLDQYLAGSISAESFANNLAKEWASLPVVTGIIGGHGFVLKPGQSYYTGDGLNKSHHDYREYLSLVKSLRAQPEVVHEVDPEVPAIIDASKDEAPHAQPKGLWAWIKSWFA